MVDADEALQMFFDEDANVPIARFSDSDLPESDDGDDVELTDDWAGYPSSPDGETASSDEENLYGGSGQPSADGESSSESESDDEFGQHYFTRTSWNLIFGVLWSLSFQNIWYFQFTKVNGCRVICTYSRGSQKWPFFTKL